MCEMLPVLVKFNQSPWVDTVRISLFTLYLLGKEEQKGK